MWSAYTSVEGCNSTPTDYWVSDDGVSTDVMPARESVMVYSSSQSVSSAESDSDSVNSLSTSYHY